MAQPAPVASTPSPDEGAYGRARRWLGASAVGSQVVLACLLLWCDPRGLIGASDGALLTDVQQVLTVLLVHTLVLLPFEWAGGRVLPRRYGRPVPPLGAFAARWLRGWATYATTVVLFSLAWMWGFRLYGFYAAVLVALLGSRVMLALQGPLARLGGVRQVQVGEDLVRSLASFGGVETARVKVVDGGEQAFVGGWVGTPGRERLWVPARWLSELTPRQLQVALLRRQGAQVTGARLLGVWVAWVFVVTGLAGSVWLSGGDLATPAGLWMVWLIYTLWSFVGLLILPSLSRAGVTALDRWARSHGASADELAGTLRVLDSLQGGEERRARWTERIFHPVPSLSARLHAVTVRPGQTGVRPWRVARTALWLGWLGGGMLSRAVHCNVGRPGVWVLLPGD